MPGLLAQKIERRQALGRSAALAARAPSARAFPSLDAVRNPDLAERAPLAGRARVASFPDASASGETPTASLLFAAGNRSGIDQVLELAAADPSFLVSFDPEDGVEPGDCSSEERWLEVLANGLTYDLVDDAPRNTRPPSSAHRYGLPADFDVSELEIVNLRPGPGIAGCARMLSVVRGLACLAAVLSELPGVRAVHWHAARTLSSPDYFRRAILRWVEGGPFPGLGLTALSSTPDGGLRSEGLALFTGQELLLAPGMVKDRAAGARLALRLLHCLVEGGRIVEPTKLTGPSGEPLMLKPAPNRNFVEVSLG